jgi:hypothetical protein
LGNGFSIACRADIFHYDSLFARADFSAIPEVVAVFDKLKTQDFEAVIKALESTASILPVYDSHGGGAVSKMLEHAQKLKDVHLTKISSNHPHLPSDILDKKFWACRKFLAHFLAGDRGCIFTLNYDLLLYWTLMHDDQPFTPAIELGANDAFGNDEDDRLADYVVWQGETAAHSAKVHFLHGALHLFDSGAELKKYTWVRKGIPLVDQARQAIAANAYPLFVAEGTSEQKKAKIRHNAYLYQGLKQLTSNAVQGRHCFFIFGHSLSLNDDHIMNRLGRGHFKKLYVGIFGDPLQPNNLEIMNRANHLKVLRSEKYPLEIAFYDAATAKVWG